MVACHNLSWGILCLAIRLLADAATQSLFAEIATLLAIAAAVGTMLRQPLIVSFIAVGLLVGLSGLSLVRSGEQINLLAHLGSRFSSFLGHQARLAASAIADDVLPVGLGGVFPARNDLLRGGARLLPCDRGGAAISRRRGAIILLRER